MVVRCFFLHTCNNISIIVELRPFSVCPALDRNLKNKNIKFFASGFHKTCSNFLTTLEDK